MERSRDAAARLHPERIRSTSVAVACKPSPGTIQPVPCLSDPGARHSASAGDDPPLARQPSAQINQIVSMLTI
jgi:hypothetical protein